MIRKIGKKRQDRIQSWWSEWKIFLQKAWDNLKRNWYYKSELTNRTVTEIYPFCFAHLLCKKNRPQFRLNKWNIIFVKSEKEHELVDKIMTLPWMKREVEEMLNAWMTEEITTFIRMQYEQQQAELDL
jgi:hypothetical protein